MPEIYWQLVQSIDGIAQACNALDVPVVSGNVSLYNDTSGVSIDPTPVIGMVGKLDDLEQRLGFAFAEAGYEVAVVGPECESTSASEFAAIYGGDDGLCPSLDLDTESVVQDFILSANRDGLLASAHDLAEGGLAVAIAECCLAGKLGFKSSPGDFSVAKLFGEGQSRFLISFSRDSVDHIDELAVEAGIRLERIGQVAGASRIQLGPISVDLQQVRNAYDNALIRATE
jgi:phosphoribosylformylglycinamidine synthase